MENIRPYTVNSITEQHRILSLPMPHHPLVSVFNFEDVVYNSDEKFQNILLNFYCIAIKKNVTGKVRYGQNYYDFDEGVMSFISPNQLIANIKEDHKMTGWCLAFHPDFIQHYALAKEIKKYGFFSYATNEALFLSEKEEEMITQMMQNIQQEYLSNMDNFSQDVIVSHIELLLNYSNRFYNRQFLTRKNVHHNLLSKMEALLTDYFNDDQLITKGIPSVSYLADQLLVSPKYLSDILRSLTGQSAQQHIHDKLIEKAKTLLSTTNLSVSEVAYQLGFEYSQSFNKLFKKKTTISPLRFRKLFN